MKVDISRLSDEERQAFADDLHNAAIYPSRLVGIGTPAHVEAINANLADLRQMAAVQAANIQRFYEIVARRAAALAQPPRPEKEKETPDDA